MAMYDLDGLISKKQKDTVRSGVAGDSSSLELFIILLGFEPK